MVVDDKGFLVQSLSSLATDTTIPLISDISVGQLMVGRPAAGRTVTAPTNRVVRKLKTE